MPEVISWIEPTDAHGVVWDRAESSASRGAARPPRQCVRQAEVPLINEHRDAREVRLYRLTAAQPYNRTCEPAYNGTVGSWTWGSWVEHASRAKPGIATSPSTKPSARCRLTRSSRRAR